MSRMPQTIRLLVRRRIAVATLAATALCSSGCGSRDEAKNHLPDPMEMFPAELSATNEQHSNDAPSIPADTSEEDLRKVNELLREYVRVRQHIPREIAELVSSGFVPQLPSAPAGKAYAILLHPLGYQVVLVNQ